MLLPRISLFQIPLALDARPPPTGMPSLQVSSTSKAPAHRAFQMASTLQTGVLQHAEYVPHLEELQSTPELPTDWRITRELQLWTRQIISQQTPQTFDLESVLPAPPPPSLLQETPILIQMSLPLLHPPPLRSRLRSRNQQRVRFL